MNEDYFNQMQPFGVPFASKEECKGLFWRGHKSLFLSSFNSIEQRRSLNFLKRKSCSGCEKCSWIWDFLKEEIPSIDNIEQGKLYTFKVFMSQGYFDSYPEVDVTEFVEIEEKSNGS